VAIYTWSGKEEAPAAASTIDTAATLPDESISEPLGEELPAEPIRDERPAAPPPPVTPSEPAPPPSPAPEPTPTPSPAPTVKIHKVKSGETLGGIAKDVLGSASKWQVIADANPGVDPYALREGMELKIPIGGAAAASTASETLAQSPSPAPSEGAAAGSTYKVRRGETLETISKKVYGTKTRWPEIWVANLAKLEDPNDVFEGMTLSLPR
jgi:nucleoid-associated protein YgaU